ncbi:unnamed protein product [Soboliphyme baturini]|uniref:40S ribosomal protein S6 n=1 Tax=Soboliphyme baturini TaxID=241478 RepID=A0A183J5Y3_9BILA|nr:unnamed protein product [Soboliphyme baturini]
MTLLASVCDTVLDENTSLLVEEENEEEIFNFILQFLSAEVLNTNLTDFLRVEDLVAKRMVAWYKLLDIYRTLYNCFGSHSIGVKFTDQTKPCVLTGRSMIKGVRGKSEADHKSKSVLYSPSSQYLRQKLYIRKLRDRVQREWADRLLSSCQERANRRNFEQHVLKNFISCASNIDPLKRRWQHYDLVRSKACWRNLSWEQRRVHCCLKRTRENFKLLQKSEQLVRDHLKERVSKLILTKLKVINRHFC